MDPDDDKKFKTYGLDTSAGLKTIDGGSASDADLDAPTDAHPPRSVKSERGSAVTGGAGWTLAMVISLVALLGVAVYFFIGGP